MRIGLVEFLLILAIASLTIGPQVALFVDRWMRRANRANARAARRRAEYAAQMAVERDALLKHRRPLPPIIRERWIWANIRVWTASAHRTALCMPQHTTAQP